AGVDELVLVVLSAADDRLAEVLVLDEVRGASEGPAERLAVRERAGVATVALMEEIESAVMEERHAVSEPSAGVLVVDIGQGADQSFDLVDWHRAGAAAPVRVRRACRPGSDSRAAEAGGEHALEGEEDDHGGQGDEQRSGEDDRRADRAIVALQARKRGHHGTDLLAVAEGDAE